MNGLKNKKRFSAFLILFFTSIALAQQSNLDDLEKRLQAAKKAHAENVENERKAKAEAARKAEGERIVREDIAFESKLASTLGLALVEMSANQRLEALVDHGVVVRSVGEGPAADAGIRPGDIIVSIKRKDVDSEDEFAAVVKSIKPGSKVPVLVVRRGGVNAYLILTIP